MKIKIVPAGSKNSELFNFVKINWELGDWESIALRGQYELSRSVSDGVLALLIASAMIQFNGVNDDVYALIKHATISGVNKKIIYKILIGNVYNTLGLGRAINGDGETAIMLMRYALELVDIKTNSLRSNMRILHQINQLPVNLSFVMKINNKCNEIEIYK